MAKIENRTKAPIALTLLGEREIVKTHKIAVPQKDGTLEVVANAVKETRVKPVQTLVVPPTVEREGLRGELELDREVLKALKTQKGFMNFVHRGDIVITEH